MKREPGDLYMTDVAGRKATAHRSGYPRGRPDRRTEPQLPKDMIMMTVILILAIGLIVLYAINHALENYFQRDRKDDPPW